MLTTDISVWRPLRGPLRRWPLALCDLRSLDSSDLVIFDEVHATAVLYSQQVVHNPLQKWYYLKDQKSTEVIIFKSMDSGVRGEGMLYLLPARNIWILPPSSWLTSLVAHGSFFDPSCPDFEPPRESIEMRVLVVY
jgi:hypothetical protein